MKSLKKMKEIIVSNLKKQPNWNILLVSLKNVVVFPVTDKLSNLFLVQLWVLLDEGDDLSGIQLLRQKSVLLEVRYSFLRFYIELLRSCLIYLDRQKNVQEIKEVLCVIKFHSLFSCTLWRRDPRTSESSLMLSFCWVSFSATLHPFLDF